MYANKDITKPEYFRETRKQRSFVMVLRKTWEYSWEQLQFSVQAVMRECTSGKSGHLEPKIFFFYSQGIHSLLSLSKILDMEIESRFKTLHSQVGGVLVNHQEVERKP